MSSDGEGFLSVSYSRATVVVADAVKELKQEKDKEIAALKQEIAELRALVQELLAGRRI